MYEDGDEEDLNGLEVDDLLWTDPVPSSKAAVCLAHAQRYCDSTSLEPAVQDLLRKREARLRLQEAAAGTDGHGGEETEAMLAQGLILPSALSILQQCGAPEELLRYSLTYSHVLMSCL